MLDGVLAIDAEPGLIHVYEKEDLFTTLHAEMVAKGFWLSNLDVKGTIRAKVDHLREYIGYDLSQYKLYEAALKTSPGWTDARYLRRLDSMTSRPAIDYKVLWLFSMVDNQLAFALDIAIALQEQFNDEDSAHIIQTTVGAIQDQIKAHTHRPIYRRLLGRIKRLLVSS